MYHRDGGWNGTTNMWQPTTGWEALGRTFDSTPSAVSWGANRLDIFALATDNRVLHKSWDGLPGTWGPSPKDWEVLPGGFHSACGRFPGVPTALTFFALGDDNGMWHQHRNGGGWLPSGVFANPDSTLSGVMLTLTHEVLEAIGADTRGPKELCNACLTAKPHAVPGPAGVSISTYFDAANNRCVAPPYLP
jgi:hypothetical protein